MNSLSKVALFTLGGENIALGAQHFDVADRAVAIERGGALQGDIQRRPRSGGDPPAAAGGQLRAKNPVRL
jgi:hypothetical protein